MPAIVTPDMVKTASPVVKEALSALRPALTKQAGKIAKGVIDRTVVALDLGFNEYLITSYNQCRLFKSILMPQAPLSVIGHYVNVKLACGQKLILKDDELIDDISSYKHVTVTGLAGSGKSMFMKYLTIRAFEQTKSGIPLFVELRNLNSLTDRSLIPYIRSTCTGKGQDVSEDQFRLALRAGAFILVLDGFDELDNEIRDDIQRQIIAINKDYPETTVIVSSRPDERFNSWTQYYVFNVQELEKAQVIKLLNNLEYDSGVKRRFIKEVSAGLYESHKSFLSSPILASIMMLTYEEFAEIPKKMHLFYGQAFDTLFQKHDAQKEQYRRKTHSDLTRADFKSCFSVFCAKGYLEQKYSFSDESMSELVDASLKYVKQMNASFPQSVTSDQFIRDLFESVCMLQKDGIETAFVHRSFQEYFAALFVSQLTGPRVKQFLDQYSRRFVDAVVPMALDMSQESVENEWVLSAIEELLGVFDLHDKRRNLGTLFKELYPEFFILNHDKSLIMGTYSLHTVNIGKIETLAKLYPKKIPSQSFLYTISLRGINTLSSIILKPEYKAMHNYGKWKYILSNDGNTEDFTRKAMARREFNTSDGDDWWLRAIGMESRFEELNTGLVALRKEIVSRNTKRAAMIDDFFE